MGISQIQRCIPQTQLYVLICEGRIFFQQKGSTSADNWGCHRGAGARQIGCTVIGIWCVLSGRHRMIGVCDGVLYHGITADYIGAGRYDVRLFYAASGRPSAGIVPARIVPYHI